MIGTGIGMLIAGIAAGTGTVVSAKLASNAAKNAGNQTAAGEEKQLAYLQQKDAQDQANFLATAAENRRQFDTTQELNYGQWANRERNLAPYRAIGSGATSTLAQLMGIPFEPGSFQPAPYRGGSSAAAPEPAIDQKISAFITNWQQTHPASEGIGPLATAIAKQFPTVKRYDYNGTPSDNELDIGGKYKVLGGENTDAAYWYAAGTNDSPGGGAARPSMPVMRPFAASAAPLSVSSLMSPTPTLAAAPPRQALTWRDYMNRLAA